MTIYTCPACERAGDNARWGEVYAHCWDCNMRALAHLYPTGIDNLSAGQHRALHQELSKHHPRSIDECKTRIRHWIGRLRADDFVDTEDLG